MKLLEIAPNFVKTTTGTLLTILLHIKDSMGSGSKIPMSAISNLMRNVGYNFTYDDFKQLYDSNEKVKQIVSNFNEEEVTVGDNNDNDSESSEEKDVEFIKQVYNSWQEIKRNLIPIVGKLKNIKDNNEEKSDTRYFG